METKVTNEQLTKVRDALAYYGHSSVSRPATTEAIAILDAELAAPEQEPFCYVNVNAQGDVTRTIKREDKWCKTPLYRHPSPQSQPVARVTGYYAGRCVIEPLDGKSVYPTGMAVYSAPVAAQSAQPVACKHNRYSVDVHEQTGTCYDCGAEGRMRFVVDAPAPPTHYDQTALERCEVCGWEKLIPGDCCLNCERGKVEQEPVPAPQREWQSLTPDEINNCAGAEIYPSTWAMSFARAIESKLKEKNHG